MLLLWDSQHCRVDARLFLGSVRSAAASPTADGAAAALAQAELVPCALQALSAGAGPVEVTPEGMHSHSARRSSSPGLGPADGATAPWC
jgi:hypothetical protein